jgi:molybdenum cofactor biosynthesis enzyme
MCKAIDKEMVIGAIQLESKEGGKSGTFLRSGN